MHILGNDADSAHDFLECCDEQEISIIYKNKDNPHELQRIVLQIKQDVDDSAKALAIDG